MSTISSSGKVAYMYDQATDTWYPIGGNANATSDYEWTGEHAFQNSVNFSQVLEARAGVNNFLNPSERDAAITSPVNGVVAFVRQNNSGEVINELQHYYDSQWRKIGDATYVDQKTASYVLTLNDAGRTIIMNSASGTVVTVPANSSVSFAIGQQIQVVRYGSGDVTISGTAGVTINSKLGNNKIAAQYSGAALTKVDTNTWLLIGDLTA